MTIDPLDVAAASMANDVARLTSISQNLVNAATPGYRRELSFATALTQQLGERSMVQQGSVVDPRAGTLRATGLATDLAIDGEGYFELSTPSGPAYTRRGDFRVDAQGRLVTAGGHALQGLGGTLQAVAEGEMSVDREGVVTQGERRIGQIKVVHFDNAAALVREAGGLFRAAEQPQPVAAGSFRIRQGQLEGSNVDTASEMVKLMETVRHFEATQKVVQGVDEMTERALRKLGEF
jgi:flagellar basal body rod protein FlgG